MRTKWMMSATLCSAMLAICGGSAMKLSADQKKTDPGEIFPLTTAYTFKTVDGLEIKADVIRAMPPGSVKQPALMWIHGGALIFGDRLGGGGIDSLVTKKMVKLGYVVVNIDYRLAPETKISGIIEDIQDAWKWINKSADKLGIDPDRIAVSGGSAGGYLTLMAGFSVTPRPRALLTFYGYGDITTPWFAQPSEFYRQHMTPKEDAMKSVGTTPISGDHWSSVDKLPRWNFYNYLRQNGTWLNEVTGHDPKTEPEWFDAYCPIRNVTKDYPPTMLVHGTKDNDVPYDESKNMAAKLKEAGVKCELVTVEGVGHGLMGAKPEQIESLADQGVAFIVANTAPKGTSSVEDEKIKGTAEKTPTAKKSVRQRPIPPERIRETFFVDLSKVANRSLVDEVEADGKGGWSDQGPECDMRELQTGRRSFNGIPFEILPSPGSVVTLRTTRGNPGDMPVKVDIAVGRKADALFFLHGAAWFGESIGSEAWFKYLIHYADGKTVEVPMTKLNMEDWVAKPVADFPDEQGTFTTVAESVKVKKFDGPCSTYMTQWSAPADRRPVEIKSIEFVSNGIVVPLLLGITGVMEK